jgi:hypothetical protein
LSIDLAELSDVNGLRLVGVVDWGPRPLVVTTAGVFEVVATSPELVVELLPAAPDWVVNADLPQVSLVGFDGSEIRVYLGMGGWSGRSVPLTDVAAVGVPAGGDGFVALAIVEGEWLLIEDLPDELYVTFPVGQRVFGQQYSHTTAVKTAHVTTGRGVWQPIDEWVMLPAFGIAPTLSWTENRSVVAAARDHPALRPLLTASPTPPEAMFDVDGTPVATRGAELDMFVGETWKPFDADRSAVPVAVRDSGALVVAVVADGLLELEASE